MNVNPNDAVGTILRLAIEREQALQRAEVAEAALAELHEKILEELTERKEPEPPV